MGRYSECEYYNSDHDFLAGRKAAERVRELAREKAAELLVETAVSGALGLPAAGL